jgi:hypothetical protein
MHNVNCGRGAGRNAAYRSWCGRDTAAGQAETFRPRRRKRLFSVKGTAAGVLLLAVVLLISGMPAAGALAAGEAATVEGPGFAAPEDAAKAYLAGLKDQDIPAMLSTFAVESKAINYDIGQYIDRLRAYTTTFTLLFPGTSEKSLMWNVESLRKNLSNQIIMQYMTFNTPEAFNDFKTTVLSTPEEISAFVGKMENGMANYVFTDLEITGAIAPQLLSDKYLLAKNQENIAKSVKPYGVEAGDAANTVILFQADGRLWVFCSQAIRYSGKWYLDSLGGNIGNLLGLSYNAGGIAPAGDLGI